MSGTVWMPSDVEVFNVSQRSDAWKILRSCRNPSAVKGIPKEWTPFLVPFRFTASEIYCLTDKNQYKSKKEYMDEVLGIKERTFTGNFHTARGQRLEPSVRDRYVKEHGTPVHEIGFVVPRWCPYIGVSPDGIMEEGCIEIKCPVKIWKEFLEDGKIKDEHYAQIQMTMVICERDWCDYLVYSESENQYIETRVKKDQEYWDDILFPAITSAIDDGKKWITDKILNDFMDFEL